MVKEKENGKVVICPDCKKEKSINDCSLHSERTTTCYYCHLIKEHMVDVKEPPKDSKSKQKKEKKKK